MSLQPSPWQPRRAHRDTERGIFGGVAAGLAEHLGWSIKAVRVGLLLLLLVHGFGLFLYAVLWLFLPAQRPMSSTPGLDAASRMGLRPKASNRLRDSGVGVAVIAIVLGLMMLLADGSNRAAFLIPAAFAAIGVGILWWQADEAQRERWRDNTRHVGPVQLILGSGGRWSWLRITFGLVLLLTALVLTVVLLGLQSSGPFTSMLAVGLGLVGLLAVIGPSLLRLSSDLSAEREARIRSEERADVAAHLHDSVLQTLALIQRSADDPTTVTKIARAQERDLRSWLFETPDSQSLSASLQEIGTQTEELLSVPVEIVCVNDGEVSEPGRILLAAAREAIGNAARHSGARAVDVYAEVGPELIEVFVRDRGRGFDPAAIPADRHGVRESIIGRMQRHGGSASIRSTPSGTEVHLSMPTSNESDAR